MPTGTTMVAAIPARSGSRRRATRASANADSNSLGLRSSVNARRELRDARGDTELAWITSHTFRKTAATILDEAALSARLIADQFGHARPSMTQDVYLGRRAGDDQAAKALERALRGCGHQGRKGWQKGGVAGK